MDFLDKNRIKVTEYSKKQTGQQGELQVPETNTYEFITEEDAMDFRTWTYDDLYNEDRKLVRKEESLRWTDTKARQFARINKKFSEKDRNNSIDKVEKIRKKKMEKLGFKHLFVKLDDKKKQMEMAEQFINLQFEAREEYIKATMENDNDYKLDLAMNRMRKYYRRTRLYLSLLRGEKQGKFRTKLQENYDKNREKLQNELNKAKEMPSYATRFKWKTVTGRENDYSEEKKTVMRAEEQRVREEKRQEALRKQAERKRKRDIIEKVLDTGIYEEEKTVEEKKPKKRSKKNVAQQPGDNIPKTIIVQKKMGEPWYLKEYKAEILKEVDSNEFFLNYPEDFAVKQVAEYNEYYKENLKEIQKNATASVARTYRKTKGKGNIACADFVDAGFSWINEMCVNKTMTAMKPHMIRKNIASITLSKYSPNLTAEENALIRESARRYKMIKDIDFQGMGINIYSSEIIKTLLTDKNVKDEDLKSLKRQLEGVDRLLRKMVIDKFGYINQESIYKGLRRFIGNKALFAGNRKIRDYAERYLIGLSYTDKYTATVQFEFDQAYQSYINCPFSELFKVSIEKCVSHANYGDPAQRKKKFSEILKFTNTFLGFIPVESAGVTMSEAGWDECLKIIRGYIMKDLYFSYEKISDDEFKTKELQDSMRKLIHEAAQKDKGEKRVSWDQLVGVKKEVREKEQAEDVNEYTYTQMLDQLFRGKNFEKIIPDPTIRVFLAENKNVFLFKNKKLIEQFPFMKKIKDIDELEDLSFDQFERVSTYLYESLADEGVTKVIGKLLKNEKIELDSKRRILLRLLSDRTDEKGAEKYIKEEADRQEKIRKLRRQKMLIAIGTSKEKRDGKIRYRYEDLRDRDKGILQNYFGKNSDWLKDRIKKFDKANLVWKDLEKLGPDAMELVRHLFKRVYESKKPQESLEKLAKCLESKNAYEDLRSHFGIGDLKLNEYTDNKKYLVNKIINVFKSKDDSAENDLIDMANKSGVEKNKKKSAKKEPGIGDFLLEMSLCGTQDILLGHNGKYQKVLFMYEDMDKYGDRLMEVAKYAIDRMKHVDKALAKYPPEVREELREKLMRTCLNIETEKYEAYIEHEELKQRNLKAIKANKETQESSINAVKEATEELMKLGNEKKNAEAEKDSLDKQIARLKQEKELKKTESQEQKNAIAEAEKKIKEMEALLKAAEKEYAKHSESFSKAEDELRKANISNKGVAKAQKSYDTATKLFRESSGKMNQLAADIKEEKKKKDTAEMYYNYSAAVLSDIASRLSQYDDNSKQLKEKIKDLTSKYNEMWERYDSRKVMTVKAENASNYLQYESEKEEEQIIDEYREESELNVKEYGIGNLQEIGDILKDCVDKNGVMSGELAESIDLYNERKKMLEEYKDGELSLISGRLLENNDILMDLLDPAESVAMARISTLYEFFAPFCLAVKKQASAFLGDYYLENNLDELLTGKGRLYNGIYHTLKEQKELDGKVNVWREVLQDFGSEYVTQQKKGTKSINENLRTATGGAVKKIQKYYLYVTKETKDEKKLQKAKFKKYWFIDSKNYGVELAAQKGGQSDFQIAQHKAEGMICQINSYITTNADCIQQACIAGTLKNLYDEISDNYIANDEAIEDYFVQYMLENKYKVTGLSSSMFSESYTTDEATLVKIMESRSPEEIKDIKIRLEDFKKYVREPSFVMKPEEFRKKLKEYTESYFEKLEIAIEEDTKLLRENADAYKLRVKEEKRAQDFIVRGKYEGRKLYNEELFGGKLDALKSFGEQKQTLVYVTKDKDKKKSIRSLGEEADKKMLESAQEYFKPTNEDKEKYPPILAEILVEYMKQYQGKLDKLDRFADWLAGFESQFTLEAKRLKNLYQIRKKQMKGEPDEGLDMFMVYAARNTIDEIEVEREMKTLGNRFNRCFKSLRELEEIPVKNPSLRLAHRDAVEKSRALLFMDKDTKPADYDKQMRALVNYFIYADQAYDLMDKVSAEDPYLGQLDNVYRNRYVNGLREFFTADIIKMSKKGEPFDAAKFTNSVKDILRSEYRRRALTGTGESVSNLDLEQRNIYPGTMSVKDFEHVLVATRKSKLVEEYNKLDATERKLFAMALYCSKMEEHGTQKVIYGQTDSGVKAARAQIMAYMKGDDVALEVDYARSIRAVSSTNKNYKISGDTKVFEEALEFIKKVKIRKEELRPKEYNRMSDSLTVIKAADGYRGKVQAGAKKVTSQRKELGNGVGSLGKFMEKLRSFAESDRERQGSQGFIGRTVRRGSEIVEGFAIEKVMDRINNLSMSQKTLLMFVLQDRTVLDFSSAGKDKKTKIVPHVNQEKRFKLYEKLVDEKGRFEALTEGGRYETVMRAYETLFSFQIRDDKELTKNKLTEDDFVKDSLNRVETIDWKLLNYAIDFLEECEGERRRLFVARQAKEIIKSADQEKPSKRFYDGHISQISDEGVDSLESFENIIQMAYKEDVIRNDKSSGFKKEADDLLSGYFKLNSAEKALFIRALENRDILDVSQKNLYKNVFGLADRDYVNEKGRDELADEFLANDCNVDYKYDSCRQALTSLLSDQVNDDMDFNEVKGVNWAKKNLSVDNQIFVTKRKTAIDWKLFKRALQFVTRTVNERKQTAGNELIYNTLGDKDKNGELKIDTQYLRMNLHNTGSRFMRFLAKEGYAEIEDNLGIFETVADYAGYVLSTKTNNFIQGELNTYITNRTAEKAAEEDKKEDDEDQEGKQEEEEKKLGFIATLTAIANDYSEQKATLEEMFKTATDTYNEVKELMSSDEKAVENTDELKEQLKDIKVPEEKKEGYTGYKYVDMVIKGGIALASVKGIIDEYAQNTEMLEKIDGYINDYLGGFMSTKSIGEWYSKKVGLVDENGNKPNPEDGFIDKKVPKAVKDKLNTAFENLEKTGELVKFVKNNVFDPTIEVIGDLKDIYESYQNISQLNEAQEKSAEKHDEDTEKIKKAKVSAEEKEAIEKARQNNIDLLKGGNDMTKNIESRKILLKTGELAQKILNFTGQGQFNNFIDKAFKFAGFIWHCMSDDAAIKKFYSSSGNEELDKLYQGREILKSKFNFDNDINISTERYEKEGDKIVVGDPQVRMLRNGLGFESDEELVKFLRLNIVNSLLFSASKFNPFAEPQLLAECTLTVLGLEKSIGKTDNDTARKVFEKLSA